MTAKIITISIPESMYRHVKDRTSGDAYASVSEYFRELIRNDQRHVQRAQQLAVSERQQLASAARRPTAPYTGRRS